MTNSRDLGYTPETSEIKSVRDDAGTLSTQLYDLIGLNAKASEPGPGVTRCEGKDIDKYYVIRHPWSLTEVPVKDMQKAMERLKEELPENGWEVVKYGQDTSPSKSLEIFANSTEKKFSVNITLYDRRKPIQRHPDSSQVSMIFVTLVSACFQVPEGKTVDEY